MKQRPTLFARRFARSSLPLSGIRIPWRQSRTVATYERPKQELLTALPGVAERASARVWRITLKPGPAEHPRFEGRSSTMIESGRMTIQYVPGNGFEIAATGPNLSCVDELGMSDDPWIAESYRPPYLTRWRGPVRDIGDFGMVANNGNEGRVAIVVERTQS